MNEKYVDPGVLGAFAVVSVFLLAWTINAYVSASPPVRGIYEEDIISLMTPSSTTTSSTTTTVASTTTSSTTTSSTTIIRWEEVACFTNAECGYNGTLVSKEYTCLEGNIYRQFIQFRCEKPGTREARCVGTEKTEFFRKCDYNEHCIEGDQYCAYTLDVPLTKADYVPENATLVYINSKGFSSKGGYTFMAMYVVSELNKPKRLAVDVIRPDGFDNWEYLGYNKGTVIGNITAGIKELYRDEYEIRATIWYVETAGK